MNTRFRGGIGKATANSIRRKALCVVSMGNESDLVVLGSIHHAWLVTMYEPTVAIQGLSDAPKAIKTVWAPRSSRVISRGWHAIASIR